MAQLRDAGGQRYFLKITGHTSEYKFFRHSKRLEDDLAHDDIRIVSPIFAQRTPGLLALVFPYHGFMLSESIPLDVDVTARAVARLNHRGQGLRIRLGASTQQRRSGFLPNIVRRNVLSVAFLKNERDVATRTMRALMRYHSVHRPVPKVLCHGDVSQHNVFQRQGEILLVDFANFLFAEPGFDLARLHNGSEEKLQQACNAYLRAFRVPLSLSRLRLGPVYGDFFLKLRRAAKGRESERFREALDRLEEELARLT